MRFTNEDKKKVLAATDILELIRKYIDLTPSGKTYKSLCPFHTEKTPSFIVSPEYQNYKCFGCGQYGDALGFIMEIENFSFMEALHYLAEKSGIIINNKDTSLLTELSECLNTINYFYTSILERCGNDTYVSQYLKKRNITSDLIQKFQLGFTTTQRNQLHKFLQYKNIVIEIQISSGLIRYTENNQLYELMYNRLIFPIKDRHGRIIGFGGRTLDKNNRKYINSPETELYKKKYVLYGIYEALSAIKKKRQVIITEGYFDVIRMHQYGWEETVGICGTAFTIEHLRFLKRLKTDNIYLLFDGDTAGGKAMQQACLLCLQNNMDCRIIQLPLDTDPDNYFIKYTSDDFRILIDNAVYDFEYILDCVKLNINVKTQNKQLQYILQLIRNISNPIKKHKFIEQTAVLFNIAHPILIAEIYKVKSGAEYKHNGIKTQLIKPDRKYNEIRFLQYFIKYPQSINLTRLYISPDLFQSDIIKAFYERCLELDNIEFSTIIPNDFIYIFPEFTKIITSVYAYNSPFIFNDEEFSITRINYLMKCLIYNKLRDNYILLDTYTDIKKKNQLFHIINTQNNLLKSL